MTRYLETKQLSKEILFAGYKPIMYPVRENPLFKLKIKQEDAKRENGNEKRALGSSVSHKYKGIWSTSILGLQDYPEWNNVPWNNIKNLKPFDEELASITIKKNKK